MQLSKLTLVLVLFYCIGYSTEKTMSVADASTLSITTFNNMTFPSPSTYSGPVCVFASNLGDYNTIYIKTNAEAAMMAMLLSAIMNNKKIQLIWDDSENDSGISAWHPLKRICFVP